MDEDGVALPQQFIQDFDALGQLAAKVIRVEIPHWNTTKLDTYLIVVEFQTTPDDTVVGHVLMGLDVQHRCDACPVQPVDVLEVLGEGADE